MKLLPFAQSLFDQTTFRIVLDRTELSEIDKAKNRFEALTGILQVGDWRKHTMLSFYLECPDNLIQILTNSNLFTIEHERGMGIMSGTVEAFERFVAKYAQASASREERAVANVFYNILNNQFGMFKTYTYKQLGDGSFTVSK